MAAVGKVRFKTFIYRMRADFRKPLLEIDVEEDEVVVAGEGSVERKAQESPKIDVSETTELQASPVLEDSIEELPDTLSTPSNSQSLQKRNNTATPAVRHLLNKLNLDIADIKGSGKGGRVSKEDIDRHVLSTASTSTPFKNEPTPVAVVVAKAEDRMSRFTSIQTQMFKTMTRSATIPHFLYTHTVDLTALSLAKTRYNSSPTNFKMTDTLPSKLTALPFIMKALSQAFAKFPALNAYLDSESPQLIIKGAHNFGIAVDTPQGLLVPVVKEVQTHSIISLAGEIGRLSKLAKAGKLTPDDFNGATFIVSNIGSIGGGAVAPVIVAPMVGILGVGKVRDVPVFKKDEHGVKKLVGRDELILSWSADHRVLDGATVARCAEEVRTLLEDIDVFSMVLR
jgi:2-oxoisovalerate dehydrogenase E2 component (dihydrolipoyl transacylase)